MSKVAVLPPEPSETFLVKIGRTSFAVPVVIAAAGEDAARRFVEFFTATIRNKNTRLAYARAVGAFLAWCEEHGLAFDDIESITVSVYIEKLLDDGMAKPSVKQHLAAIRMMFDWMVTGGILPYNPAAAVRGPRYVIKKGKTPVLTPDEARLLLDSIPLIKTITRRDGSTIEKPNLVGLRDRALLAVMVYSFARVSAVVGMDIDDYYQQGKRWWIRLHEKGGKHHEVPVHHKAEEYLDAYLAAAGIKTEKDTPLWRCVTKERSIGDGRLTCIDVYRMIKRRCRQAELGATANCHTFRATGITAYLLNGGSLENAQAIAAHESPRTTKLNDRTSDEITLDEIERIGI
jgi:integrase/recombinase XerD